jgi:hypothetical protein
MEERMVYDRINEMLADTEYSLEVRDIADIEEFLNDQSNTELDVYDEITELYNKLLEEPEDE